MIRGSGCLQGPRTTRSKVAVLEVVTSSGVETHPRGKQSYAHATADVNLAGLRGRSSYVAEALAAAHNTDDGYPLLITLHELVAGLFTPMLLRDLREIGGFRLKVPQTMTINADSVHEPLASKHLDIRMERTLQGHTSWVCEQMEPVIAHSAQRCDTGYLIVAEIYV